MAFNEYGDSDFSHELIVGLGANAPAPTSLVRDYFASSPNSLTVVWTAVTISDLPITGYGLEIDDGLNGPFENVYDGRENT